MTQVQTVPTEKEAALKVSISDLVASSKGVVILNHADLSAATDLCAAIKARLKEAEATRTSITQPINEGLRQVNARFKAMTDPLQDAEQFIKGKMVEFQMAYEKKQREEAARQQREAEERARQEREAAEQRMAEEAKQAEDPTLDRPAPPVQAAPVEPPPPAPIVPQIRKTTYGQSGASATFKNVWTFEIEDATKIPNAYMLPDNVKIGNAVKAGIRQIPGVRIFETKVAAVK